MDWEQTYKHLTDLLDRDKTEEVLAKTQWMLPSQHWFSEYASKHDKAEAWALRGMAFYRRNELGRARTSLDSALGYNPANKRALQGIQSLNDAASAELMKSKEEERYGFSI